MKTYTKIDLDDEGKEFAYNCNDCGAYSLISETDVKHHSTCKDGESVKWQKIYEKEAEEEKELNDI